MTDTSSSTHLKAEPRLSDRVAADRAEIDLLADQMNEGTGLSWLWAFLFGPLYYAVFGFWGRAGIVFVLSLFFIGIIVSPFLAAGAWRGRALEKAEKMILLDRVRNR
ncbi:MAG: hypothetical protein AAF366_01485 [Pseudomonadota bacterium]